MNLLWSAYEYDKYAKICTPILQMVPCCCKWEWVWLGLLLLMIAGGGCSAVAPSVAEAMEAGFLPALGEDQADIFTPLDLLLYQHVQDHRLLTSLRDILGYPSLCGYILG